MFETTLELPWYKHSAVALVSTLFPVPVRNVVSSVFSIYFLSLFLKPDIHWISHWSCLNEKKTLLLKSHNLGSTDEQLSCLSDTTHLCEESEACSPLRANGLMGRGDSSCSCI